MSEVILAVWGNPDPELPNDDVQLSWSMSRNDEGFRSGVAWGFDALMRTLENAIRDGLGEDQ